MRDLEVVVVDDASLDGTREIVGAIADPRVRLIARERNGGAAAARNSGIAASHGTYVAFLDSDDTWLETKLERQLEVLTSAPPAAAVAVTGVEMHLLDHGITRAQYFVPVENWAHRLAMNCDLSPGSTQLAPRTIFDVIGPLDETLPRFEDWDWLVRYTRTGTICGVREPMARVYNRRARLADDVAKSADRFLAKHKSMFDALNDADRKVAIADLLLQVAGTYAFEGRFSAMLPSTLAAMRQRPLHTMKRLIGGAGAVALGRIRGGRTRNIDGARTAP